MEDAILNALAFKYHLEGGQAHMYAGFTFNPMLIFEEQCSCERKSLTTFHMMQADEARKQARQLLLDMEQFNTLFEPREV